MAIPGNGGYLRPERATAVSVTTSYGWLSIGFSGDLGQELEEIGYYFLISGAAVLLLSQNFHGM